MPKHSHHTKHEPIITLTPAEEVHHRATTDEGRGEIEVVGLLGLATLVFSTGLLAIIAA